MIKRTQDKLSKLLINTPHVQLDSSTKNSSLKRIDVYIRFWRSNIFDSHVLEMTWAIIRKMGELNTQEDQG